MAEQLKQEFDRFLAFIEKEGVDHAGKMIAIKGDDILGIFDTYAEAANAVYAEHEPGTVLIQQVKESIDALTVVFHSPRFFSSMQEELDGTQIQNCVSN